VFSKEQDHAGLDSDLLFLVEPDRMPIHRSEEVYAHCLTRS